MKLWDAEQGTTAALGVTRAGGVMKLWDAENGTTRPR